MQEISAVYSALKTAGIDALATKVSNTPITVAMIEASAAIAARYVAAVQAAVPVAVDGMPGFQLGGVAAGFTWLLAG